jgi:hypothetical protein
MPGKSRAPEGGVRQSWVGPVLGGGSPGRAALGILAVAGTALAAADRRIGASLSVPFFAVLLALLTCLFPALLSLLPILLSNFCPCPVASCPHARSALGASHYQ